MSSGAPGVDVSSNLHQRDGVRGNTKKLVCGEVPTTCLASDRIDGIGVGCCHCYSHFQAVSPCLLTLRPSCVTQENQSLS